jgi:hypothetical protein
MINECVCFATRDRVTVASSSQRDSDEWATLLALAVPQFAHFFRCELPLHAQLLVEVFDSGDAMNASIARDNGLPQTLDIVGGYTWRLDQRRVKSVLARQTTAYYLRTLMIHETAHQFYFHSFGINAGDELPLWFCEATVEHLSLHTWDGATLRLGVTPLVSLECYASRALEAAREFDLLATIGPGALNRPLGTYLVRFLAVCFTDRFYALCDAVQRRQPPSPESFFDWFDVSEALFRFRFIEWLTVNQEMFTTNHRGWDSRGADLLVATPDFFEAIWCVCTDSVRLNEFTLQLTGQAAGGIMIDCSPLLFLWVEDETANFKQYDGAWQRGDVFPVQPMIENDCKTYRISISYKDDMADHVCVNETFIPMPERTGRLGLATYGKGKHASYSNFNFTFKNTKNS